MKTIKFAGVFATIFSIMGLFSNEFFINLAEEQKFIIKIVFIVLLIVGLVLDVIVILKKIITWLKENTLPYPKKNRVGILISCETAYDDAENFFSKSFLHEFKKLLQTEKDLEVLTVPEKVKKKLSFGNQDKGDKTAKLLNSHNILLYLDYDLKSDGGIGKRHHVFYCNEFLIHRRVSKDLKNIIKTQLREIALPISKISFLEEKNIDDIEKYNQTLLLTSKYLISISLILYGDFIRARRMFYDIMLEEEMTHDSLSNLIKNVKEKASINYVTLRFIELHQLVVNTNISDYKLDVTEKLINEIAQYEKYLKNMYLIDFYVLRARHIFICACKSCAQIDDKIINEIQHYNYKLNPRSVGKIVNDVFLLAIKDSSITVIQKKLKRIEELNISQRYNFVHSIAFIEETLQYYPQYKKMYLALGKYYVFQEQFLLALESYKKCLDIDCDIKEKQEIQKEIANVEKKL